MAARDGREVYSLEAGRWVVASTHAGSEALGAATFAEAELDPSRWWIDSA